ncbi:MAG TPA: glycosyltransferase family 2 protein [Caulobacteraceae bacterium]|nr:glycosyltransferase family 2 protein [Caulobacteraceae bacterium]
MTLISAITTCKGRLAHLQQTLPTLMALPDCEVVVVDYDCPQGAGDWVRSTFPAAKVVHVADRPHFKLAEARNRGVAAATAPWLFLVDADVAVAPAFVATIAPLLRAGVFLRPTPISPELSGTFVVARSDFAAIGGYDEVFEGWGGEDIDVVKRLEDSGRQAGTFPGELLRFAAHGDEVRGFYHAVGNPRVNVVINSLYRRVKNDLAALGVDPPEEIRRTIYDQIRREFLSPSGQLNLDVTFQRAVHGRALTTTLRYRLTR